MYLRIPFVHMVSLKLIIMALGAIYISAWAIGVARSTMVGNARALMSGMSNSMIPHAFCMLINVLLLIN